jgi:hypothetical protein
VVPAVTVGAMFDDGEHVPPSLHAISVPSHAPSRMEMTVSNDEPQVES